MPWLENRQFRSIRDHVVTSLRRSEYRFKWSKKVVFICGGYASARRDVLSDYITRRKDVLLFRAEHVWEAISNQAELSAMAMEAQLAQLADMVVVVVESPGSFAELGAFSLNDDLRKKLFPILDRNERNGISFIETGPVRWIDRESRFRPSLWTDFRAILLGAGDVDERLDRIGKSSMKTKDLASSQRHLLFFVCDIVAIAGPCPESHVRFYVESIVGKEVISIPLLLALAVALDLVRKTASSNHYYRPPRDGQLISFHHTRKYVDLGHLRAAVVGVMMRIPEAQVALGEIKN